MSYRSGRLVQKTAMFLVFASVLGVQTAYAEGTSWFWDPASSSDGKSPGSPAMRERVSGESCDNFPAPGYGEGSNRGCGMRMLPVQIESAGKNKWSCVAQRFADVYVDIKAITPITESGQQKPHLYLGVQFKTPNPKDPEYRDDTTCRVDGFWELGMQDQGSSTYGSDLTGLYMRAAPNGFKGETLRKYNEENITRINARYGIDSSGTSRGVDTIVPRDNASYLTGSDSLRSRFRSEKPMNLKAGFSAVESVSDSGQKTWKVMMYVAIKGECLQSGGAQSNCPGPVTDQIALDVGSVDAAKIPDSGGAVRAFLKGCVQHERLTLDGPVKKPTKDFGPGEWQPFTYRLPKVAFSDPDGKPLQMNGVLAHYPDPIEIVEGASCMDVQATFADLGGAQLNHVFRASNWSGENCVDCNKDQGASSDHDKILKTQRNVNSVLKKVR